MIAALSIIAQVLGWTLLAVSGLVLLIVLTPLRIRLKGSINEQQWSGRGFVGLPGRLLGFGIVAAADTTRVELYLASFRLLRRPWSPFGRDKTRPPKKPRPQKKGAPQKKEKSDRLGLVGTRLLLGTPHKRELASRVFKAFSPRGHARGVYGTGDPASTATIATALGLVEHYAPGLGQELTADYLDETLDLTVELELTIWIARLLTSLAGFGVSRRGREMIGHLWALRRRQRPA